MMKEYTARALMDEIRRKAEVLPSGLDCKVVVGDVERNHSVACHLEIQSDAEMDIIEILCDPDETVHLMPRSITQ